MLEVRVSSESQESADEMLDMEICEVLKITFQTPSFISMWTNTSPHAAAAESSGTL